MPRLKRLCGGRKVRFVAKRRSRSARINVNRESHLASAAKSPRLQKAVQVLSVLPRSEEVSNQTDLVWAGPLSPFKTTHLTTDSRLLGSPLVCDAVEGLLSLCIGSQPKTMATSLSKNDISPVSKQGNTVWASPHSPFKITSVTKKRKLSPESPQVSGPVFIKTVALVHTPPSQKKKIHKPKVDIRPTDNDTYNDGAIAGENIFQNDPDQTCEEFTDIRPLLITSSPVLKNQEIKGMCRRSLVFNNTSAITHQPKRVVAQNKGEALLKLPQKVEIQRHVLTFEFCFGQSENEFRRLTGIYQVHFSALLEFLGRDVCDSLKYHPDRATPKQKGRNSNVSTETRLLITLLRLRRGWDLKDIALFFGLSSYFVSRIVFTWVQFMYLQFKRIQSAMFVSRQNQPRSERPKVFKPFNNFRVCLDTTEIRIEVPSNLEQQGNTYSDYKAGNVWLYLIGISCWGGISFISPGFEGSMSDEEIFRKSGIRDFLEPGDVILADRGFKVEEECDEDGTILLHPPFLKGRSHFTPEEEMLTREIAQARIFVEHLMRKIKVFKILKKVPNNMLHYLDQVVYVCGCLVNFLPCQVRAKVS